MLSTSVVVLSNCCCVQTNWVCLYTECLLHPTNSCHGIQSSCSAKLQLASQETLICFYFVQFNQFLLNLSRQHFFFLICQEAPAFLIIFITISWPPEYFIAWIFEHTIYLKKNRVSALKNKI